MKAVSSQYAMRDRGSATLSWPRRWPGGVGGRRHARQAAWLPIIQEAGWTSGQVWTLEKSRDSLHSIGVRTPNHPARGESLYRLSCPGPKQVCVVEYYRHWILENWTVQMNRLSLGLECGFLLICLSASIWFTKSREFLDRLNTFKFWKKTASWT